MAPETNARNLEGVVALKLLQNDLLAVIYTNGLLRIVQISSLSVLIETNLLADLGHSSADLFEKIVNAKIATHTNMS